MARRHNWRDRQNQNQVAVTVPASPNRTAGVFFAPQSQAQRTAETLAAVQKTLSHIKGGSVSRVQGLTPAARSAVLTAQSPKAFGNAPREVVKAHRQYASNNPSTMHAVNLIQSVIRTHEDAQVSKGLIENQSVTRGLTPDGSLALSRHGVTGETGKRANHACLSEHRPDNTPKGGGGTNRAFVHWCSKGEGKK